MADVSPDHLVPKVEDESLHGIRQPTRSAILVLALHSPADRQKHEQQQDGGQEEEDNVLRRRQIERERADVNGLPGGEMPNKAPTQDLELDLLTVEQMVHEHALQVRRSPLRRRRVFLRATLKHAEHS